MTELEAYWSAPLAEIKKEEVMIDLHCKSCISSTQKASLFPVRSHRDGPSEISPLAGTVLPPQVTLGLVDFSMLPHLDHEMLPENSMAHAEKWAAGIRVPAYAMDDQAAIKVIDGMVEVFFRRPLETIYALMGGVRVCWRTMMRRQAMQPTLSRDSSLRVSATDSKARRQTRRGT